MLSSSFHVTLPSDSNQDVFPDNRAADYRVRVNHPITLSDATPWEVAVTDLIVPANIQSTNTEAWFQIQNVKGEISKQFFIPGLHFYQSNSGFLTRFKRELQVKE